ncbi:MAG: bifunctional precorrin-2 dehydrogenase/sirohydrochlorin ferrochelatase [Dehalococcoidia bacterium]|nr:bifunctional precorrin-2 dehydrogenase/sirohydrochlorin ferrochelatase [Dehalococcoidia bacterium]
MTRYYPVSLDLRHRRCVVIGGGRVAERKVLTLLDYEAKVVVVAPEVTPKLDRLASDGTITLERRAYRRGDLAGAFVAMGATDNTQVNEAVFLEAQSRGVLVNIADDPAHCNFIVPATVRRGDLNIAITTGGKSPALARQLRQELEELFPPEYAQHLQDLASFRRHLRDRLPDPARREVTWRALMSTGLLDLLRQDRTEEAWAMVREAAAQAGETE